MMPDLCQHARELQPVFLHLLNQMLKPLKKGTSHTPSRSLETQPQTLSAQHTILRLPAQQ